MGNEEEEAGAETLAEIIYRLTLERDHWHANHDAQVRWKRRGHDRLNVLYRYHKARVDALEAEINTLHAAISAVGLPEGSSIETLIAHHRANAALAVGFDVVAAKTEVKALKPLAELAGELRKRGEFSHSWGKGIKDDDDYIAPCRRLYSDYAGTKSEDCTCGLDALLATTDSALKAQGAQANSSKEER